MESKFDTLTDLEKAVLLDILKEEKCERGFLCWRNALFFGDNQGKISGSRYAGGIASLNKKGVITSNKFRFVKEINDSYRPN